MIKKTDKAYSNDALIEALKDKLDIVKSLTLQDCYSDEQLAMLNWYNGLPVFEQDIIYLSSVRSLTEVAQLYGITKAYVTQILHKIYEKKNTNLHNRI